MNIKAHRLGVIVPSVNTVVEPWFNAVRPSEVTIHAARMFLDSNLTADAVVRMDREDGVRAVKQIMSCKPRSVAYCCTASSIVQGPAYDAELNRDMSAAAGVPVFTAMSAIIEALRLFGVSRLAMTSPYTATIDAAEHAYFEASGYEIMGAAHLGIADAFLLAAPSPEDIVGLARRAWHPQAQALVITCLNLRSHEVIVRLEQELGVPVVSSTQATLWKLLRSAELPLTIRGYGRLLAEH